MAEQTTTVRGMFAFMNGWTGSYFSECAGLRRDIQDDLSLLDLPVYVYVTPERIVFTTVEGDHQGFLGSSFIAVLTKTVNLTT